MATVTGYTKTATDALVAGVLPTQTGNSGKVLTTNGTAASWGTGNALAVATTVTTSGALVVSKHSPVDASGGAKTMTLPTGQAEGTQIIVEKVDNTANPVAVTGNMRGSAGQSVSLNGQYESISFLADSAGSWHPGPSHKTKAWLDATYARPTSRLARLMGEETALTVAPTFSTGASATPTLTNTKFVSAITAGPFAVSNTDTGINAGTYLAALAQTNSSNIGNRQVDVGTPMRVSFDFDGQAFEILAKVTTIGPYFRVWANEQVSAAYQADTSGGTGDRVIKVDFGSRAYRRVVIEFEIAAYFSGIYIAKTDSIVAPSMTCPLKAAFVGDSYVAGLGAGQIATQGSANSFYGYPQRLARLLGFVDTRNYGVPGTGFLKDNGTALHYVSRIADVLAYQPDVVFVQASLNDDSLAGTSVIGPAVTSYLTALRNGLPATSQIVVISPLHFPPNVAGDTANATEVSTAVAALGVPYIDALNAGWATGTGRVGATTSDGNSDYYASNTATGHPTIAGHAFLARNLARAAAPLLKLAL